MIEYQYETSPRKIRPDYEVKPKKKNKKKKIQKVKPTVTTKTQVKVSKSFEEFMFKFKVLAVVLIAFSMLFIVIYRNSQINESFSKIQKLKAQVTNLQKENEQLEISIQNSLNSNNIEKSAKELLGMQKLSSKQIIHITLPKKDYVAPKVEEIIIEDNTKTGLGKIIENIKDLL